MVYIVCGVDVLLLRREGEGDCTRRERDESFCDPMLCYND